MYSLSDDEMGGAIPLTGDEEENLPPLRVPWRQRARIWTAKRWLGFKDYWRQLWTTLGWRFLVFLGFSQMLQKGLLQTLLGGTLLPYFKPRADASTFQIYSMIIMIPWSIKPIIGLASDLILVGGYNKRAWLVLSTIVGTVGAGVLLVPAIPVLFAVGCFTCISLEISLFDLLSEGKYSEVRKANPAIGSSISSLVQGMQSLGALVALSFVGSLSDAGLFEVTFVLMTILCAIPLGPTLLGWLPEIKAPGAFFQWANMEQLRRDWAMVSVIAFCGVSSIITGLVVQLTTPFVGLVVAFVLLCLSLAGCWATFPAPITQVALYSVLTTIGQPSMGGALDYFYTASPVCLPDGPAFSYLYYIAVTGIVGTLFRLLGSAAYEVFLSRLRFRPVLLITTVLVCLAGLSDFILVMRWNKTIGIPDKTFYLFGEAILEPLLSMLNWIPASALIALAVPDGMEASSFAFMAGISNFSSMVSQLTGLIIFTAAGVTADGDACNFEALPWLVLMCHICFPLMMVPAIYFIPDIRQTDALE